MATHTTLVVQRPSVPPYNHPCGDLLDGGRRTEYLEFAVPLYRASIEGDSEAAKLILHSHEYLVRYSITEKKETPLHVAVASHSTDFVSYLVDMMSAVDLELHNGDGNTAFCIAAILGNVGMVETMFQKNKALPNIPGSENMMPLHLAALNGNHDMVTFLYNLSDRMTGDHWTNDEINGVFLKCIQAGIYDVALRILKDHIKLLQDKQHVWDVLQLLARNPAAFHEKIDNWTISPKSISNLLSGLVSTPALNKYCDATLLLRLLWKRIMLEKPKDVIDEILKGPVTIPKKKYTDTTSGIPVIKEHEIQTYPSQILFIAAKMNNKAFLVELIREYPDLIWKRNDDGQTIFHIAIAYRQPNVYSLLYEIGSMKDLITPISDHQNNNILHLVGKKPEKNGYDQERVTIPFQMFSEFSWYKEVKGILPPPYRDVKNASGETPQELFTKNHEKLVSDGMEYINESINISMVVAALVCTIGFSVAYSIPGGFHQDTGFPMFLHNKYFTIFVLVDALSFLFSTLSIFCFLFIVLSRQHTNMKLLLIIWLTGKLSLLESVLFVVFAFLFSFFILYPNSAWTYIIYGVSYPLMISYAIWSMTIILNAVRPTLEAKLIFRPKKHTLHRKN